MTTKTCPKHPDATFYTAKHKYGTYLRCMTCRVEATSNARRKIKRILVERLGGRCVCCGYNNCIAALEFHHRDPNTKEFGIAHKGKIKGLERSWKEVQKCVLVCANCHREIESGVRQLPERSVWESNPLFSG